MLKNQSQNRMQGVGLSESERRVWQEYFLSVGGMSDYERTAQAFLAAPQELRHTFAFAFGAGVLLGMTLPGRAGTGKEPQGMAPETLGRLHTILDDLASRENGK